MASITRTVTTVWRDMTSCQDLSIVFGVWARPVGKLLGIENRCTDSTEEIVID